MTPATIERCRCLGTGLLGWKQPLNYPLSEVTFCECRHGIKALEFWKQAERNAQQESIERLFASSGIPENFRSFTIDSLAARVGNDPGKAQAIAAARLFSEQGFVEDPASKRYKTGLIFSGACGMAKTGLLTPVLNSFIARGKSALWIEVYDLISEIQDGYSTGESNKRLEAARTADVILLDDLGDADREATETDDRRRIIFQIINHRYNGGLPTLITTNLNGKQLTHQFGARVFERIIESCLWVKVAGKNLRMEV